MNQLVTPQAGYETQVLALKKRLAKALEETAQLHWYAAQLGKVEPVSDAEVRSVMTGMRYEEFFAHVWGHYEAMDPRNRR